MASLPLFLALFVALASGGLIKKPSSHRIVGGSVTTINEYPYGVALLSNFEGHLNWWVQECGGTILTTTAILTAGHCVNSFGETHNINWNRARVGSTFANSGGTVHLLSRITDHPNYVWYNTNNDVAVLRTATTIGYISGTVAPGSIAGANYNLADNQVVWAMGWGTSEEGASEQLRHVQVWTINQDTCNERYRGLINDGMLCSGWLDVGGRDQCQGDSGGPLLHNNVVVGICSWGYGCADAYFPGVNARVSHFSTWIATTAVAA